MTGSGGGVDVAGAGDEVQDGSDRGEGGGNDSIVMFREDAPSLSRKVSGSALSSTSPGGEADRRDVVPLLLARRAAR